MGSPMVEAHAALAAMMRDASVASVHLAMDPNNDHAATQWWVAQTFVHEAVAHMAEEEADAFEQAARNGVSREILQGLRLEHARLRLLAAELLTRLSPDDEGALLLLRFLHRFEKHVRREESSLRPHLSEDECA